MSCFHAAIPTMADHTALQDMTALLTLTSAAAVSVAAAVTALLARFDASLSDAGPWLAAQWCAIDATAHGAVTLARGTVCDVAKWAESDAECWRVTSEQLLACCVRIDAALRGDRSWDDSLDACMSGLLGLVAGGAPHGPPFCALATPAALVTILAASPALRLRDDICTSLCTVGGPGALSCLPGGEVGEEAHNVVTLACRDGCGDPVALAAVGDVTVTLSYGTVSVRLSGDGECAARIRLPPGSSAPLTLTLAPFGRPLPPLTIQACAPCVAVPAYVFVLYFVLRMCVLLWLRAGLRVRLCPVPCVVVPCMVVCACVTVRAALLTCAHCVCVCACVCAPLRRCPTCQRPPCWRRGARSPPPPSSTPSPTGCPPKHSCSFTAAPCTA